MEELEKDIKSVLAFATGLGSLALLKMVVKLQSDFEELQNRVSDEIKEEEEEKVCYGILVHFPEKE